MSRHIAYNIRGLGICIPVVFLNRVVRCVYSLYVSVCYTYGGVYGKLINIIIVARSRERAILTYKRHVSMFRA